MSQIFDPQGHSQIPDVLPTGRYVVTVADVTKKGPSKNGNYYYSLRLSVPNKGLSVFHRLTVVESAYGMWGEFCSACSHSEKFDLDSEEAVTGAFMGKSLAVQVSQTEFRGEPRNEVRKCYRLTNSEVDGLALGAANANSGGNSGAGAASPSAPVSGVQPGIVPPDDDDIPF